MSEEPKQADAGPRGAGPDAGKGPRPVRPPPRSRRARSRIVVFFNTLLSGALVVCLAAAVLFFWGRSEFESPGPLEVEKAVVVPQKARAEAIGDILERAGVISNARVFQAGIWAEKAGAKLKAGEYGFEPGISMRGVLDKLMRGDSILHSVVIPEGWTVKQIFDRVGAEEVLTGDLPPMPAEGTLRPDTYRVQRGMARAELIRKMQEAQTDLVAEVWERRDKDLPLKDIGQFVTLASIVEKETGKADERPRVAAVFMNRLKKGMRLQSDPTIIYAVWGGAGKPSDEPIRQSHIRNESPYNTYVVKGLPPGPIACPGRAALEAVANPATTKDVYFVADGDGGHVFASTLEEHNANVRRYREIEKQRNLPVPATVGLDDPVLAQ
ncbi:4-amino-4-deoxychorismate lyase [Aureimonas endophytica]|uniref:Endolytic murein transglycosylase n=1 Tax=Aureimonas endophytica TaxID=2027858 RepID=A0A916ZB88_9HYPH|nr:endolytic transglycosylase MltG [Aureimonas endophytica]GGD85616.1 4-amino-4-deoxychorismate lyase [Aureimonas endophytica]